MEILMQINQEQVIEIAINMGQMAAHNLDRDLITMMNIVREQMMEITVVQQVEVLRLDLELMVMTNTNLEQVIEIVIKMVQQVTELVVIG